LYPEQAKGLIREDGCERLVIETVKSVPFLVAHISEIRAKVKNHGAIPPLPIHLHGVMLN
jgi:methionine synthase I (cobalamin-dependent)